MFGLNAYELANTSDGLLDFGGNIECLANLLSSLNAKADE